MQRRSFILGALLILTACDKGGQLSLNENALLNGSRSKFTGSCAVLSHPLVLTDGYCVEFHRIDTNPGGLVAECGQAGGVWGAQTCVRPANLEGRCLIKNGGDIDLIYFAGSGSGPARCQEVPSSYWQTSF